MYNYRQLNISTLMECRRHFEYLMRFHETRNSFHKSSYSHKVGQFLGEIIACH